MHQMLTEAHKIIFLVRSASAVLLCLVVLCMAVCYPHNHDLGHRFAGWDFKLTLLFMVGLLTAPCLLHQNHFGSAHAFLHSPCQETDSSRCVFRIG
jgi:hypothetical protein